MPDSYARYTMLTPEHHTTVNNTPLPSASDFIII